MAPAHRGGGRLLSCFCFLGPLSNDISTLAFQIYDNAMIAAGLVDDPRPMVGRLNDLLTKALERR